MRFVKRVNERGTTTLPNEVRQALDIRQGDLVEFEVLRVIRRDRAPRAQEFHDDVPTGIDPDPQSEVAP